VVFLQKENFYPAKKGKNENFRCQHKELTENSHISHPAFHLVRKKFVDVSPPLNPKLSRSPSFWLKTFFC
jgi:hypothetical protein